MVKTLKQFINENTKQQSSTLAHNIFPETWEKNIPGAGHVTKRGNKVTFYSLYFHRDPDITPEQHAEKISEHLHKLGIEHTVVGHSAQEGMPFNSKAGPDRQNHVQVTVEIHPGQHVRVGEGGDIQRHIPGASHVTESQVVNHAVTFVRDGPNHYKVSEADEGGRFKLGERVHEKDLPWGEPDTVVKHEGPARVQFTFTAGG